MTAFRFAANLSFMFDPLPWDERFALAARLGFPGVEMNPPYPYEMPASRFAARLRGEGLVCPMLVAPLGEEDARFGYACLPGARETFRRSILTLIDYASAAEVPLAHVCAGLAPPDVPRAEAEAVCVENLVWAAEQAAAAGILLCIEPICEQRVPGFLLKTTNQALDMIARTERDDIRLLFDAFHVEMQEGAAHERLPALLPHVAYVQVSDTPDRRRPGLGRIDFDAIFGLLGDRGYAGWVGCEYFPEPGRADDLDWARRWWRAGQADGSGVEA